MFNKLTYQVIGAAFTIHNAIGPHQRKAHYLEAMIKEMESRGVVFRRPFANKNVDFWVSNQIAFKLFTQQSKDRLEEFQMRRFIETKRKQMGVVIYFEEKVTIRRVYPFGKR